MKQNDAIMIYLREHGSITQRDALEHCRCMRLASRIHELRKQAEIVKTMEYGLNADGEPCKWARYTLIKETV